MANSATDRRPGANPVFRAQIENLYVEAMVLADEAYGCFAVSRDRAIQPGQAAQRVALACESLKTTTRLMHVIAWLLHQRALLAGEPGASDRDSAAQLGDALAADRAMCDRFDPAVQRIVYDSERLFERVCRLDAQWRGLLPLTADQRTPVQSLLNQISARL